MLNRAFRLAILLLSLHGFSLPGVAAIRATGDLTPLGFIPLPHLRDPQATFYLSLGQRFWDRVPRPVFPIASKPEEQQDLPSLLLNSWLNKLDKQTSAIFNSCLHPDVLEFTLIRWPPRPGLGEDRVVWLAGMTLSNVESVPARIESIRQAFGVPPEDVFSRTRNGRRYFTLIQPTGNTHIIPGDSQLFLSPNLFLVQSILDQGAPPPEPPGITREASDAVLGWRFPSSSSLTELESDSPYFPLARLLIDNQFELSIQTQDHGLGLTLRLGVGNNGAVSTEPIELNPDLLASVPPDASLILVSGGIPAESTHEEGELPELDPWFRRPFALGLTPAADSAPPPEGWRLEGAFEALEEVRSSSDEQALLEVEELATGATGEWTFANLEDRIRFSSEGRLEPEIPPSDAFRERAERFLDGAFLGGLVTPQLLTAPFVWQAVLEDQPESAYDRFTHRLASETTPIEFNVGRDAEGLRIRFFTEKPVSYLLFLSSLLFAIDMEYGGSWNELASVWAQQTSLTDEESPEISDDSEPPDDGPDWPARLRGVPSAP